MNQEDRKNSETAREEELAQRLNQEALDQAQSDPEISGLCRKAAAEGTVLLKNNGVLPLKKTETVSWFGRVQCNYFYVGYGSGGDVIPPYRVSPADALQQRSDIKYNQSLFNLYRTWSAKHIPYEGTWADWPTCFDEMPLSEEQVREAAAAGETAVVLLGRAMGESLDNRPEPGAYYLTSEEEALLDRVTEAFKNIVIVINAGNLIDLSWLEKYNERISALVYAWQGGMESGNALLDVLYGDICPSGRLTDTIACRYSDYPASKNFGSAEYNEYQEDIYVGYRYFETFAKSAVMFPFGYGLSYTSFSLQNSAGTKERSFWVKSEVRNTGSRSGAQVLQLYLRAPQGKLGKSVRELAAFGRTKELRPNEAQTLRFEVSLDHFAAYDDCGLTGYRSSYVLEEGIYELYIGTDVQHTEKIGQIELTDTVCVCRREERCAPVKAFRRIRPVEKGEELISTEEAVPLSQQNSRPRRILDDLPAPIAYTGDRGIKFSQVRSGTASMDAFLAQFSEKELEAVTRGEGPMDSAFGPKGNAGMFGGTLESLRAKEVPSLITTDGPSGVRVRYHSPLLPCGTALACTWDEALVYELYKCFGKKLPELGSHMLLGPGMNIHRDPMCGRNFEYFSEDPYLTGKMAAAVVKGIQSNGRSACPKHFACNNQEYMRNRSDSRVSERALREIYLKGFEICVKEAAPFAIMTSYNKINGVWSHYNHDLVTGILRGEWGYDGVVITDWWMQPDIDPDFPAVTDNAYRIRAQVDVLMPGCQSSMDAGMDDTVLQSLHKENGLTIGELQRSASNVLKFALRIK